MAGYGLKTEMLHDGDFLSIFLSILWKDLPRCSAVLIFRVNICKKIYTETHTAYPMAQ